MGKDRSYTMKLEEIKQFLQDPKVINQLCELGLAEKRCWNCKWFILRPTHGNRVCQCPEKLVWTGAGCQMWELEPNPRNRKRRIC